MGSKIKIMTTTAGSAWGLLLVGLLCSLTLVDAKVNIGVARLDSMITELFVAKFAFSSSAHGVISGDFNVTARYLAQRPDWLKYGQNVQYRSLQVAMYNEQAWAKYNQAILKGSLCVDRLRMAIFRKLVPLGDLKEGETEDVKFTMDEVVKPEVNSHYWYGIVADCSLEEYDAHPPKLAYTIVFKNGDSHLPADEDGMFGSHIFVMVLLVGCLCALCYGIHKSLQDTKQVHLAVLIVLAAAVFQLLSVVCELLHLRTYMQDGLGLRWRYTWFPCDFYSEVWQGLSELLIQFMLISLAFGWTIVPNAGEAGTFFKSLARPYELFKQVSRASIFVIVLATAQFSLELCGRAYEDDFNQFHDHEHWPGYLLMGMRVVLASLFLYGVRLTKKETTRSDLPEVSRFFLKLQLTGCLWFLAFPVLVFMASLVRDQNKHRVVSIGAIMMQMGALGYLMFMLLTKSDYYKISTLRNMGSMFGSGDVRAGKVCVD